MAQALEAGGQVSLFILVQEFVNDIVVTQGQFNSISVELQAKVDGVFEERLLCEGQFGVLVNRNVPQRCLADLVHHACLLLFAQRLVLVFVQIDAEEGVPISGLLLGKCNVVHLFVAPSEVALRQVDETCWVRLGRWIPLVVLTTRLLVESNVVVRFE